MGSPWARLPGGVTGREGAAEDVTSERRALGAGRPKAKGPAGRCGAFAGRSDRPSCRAAILAAGVGVAIGCHAVRVGEPPRASNSICHFKCSQASRFSLQNGKLKNSSTVESACTGADQHKPIAQATIGDVSLSDSLQEIPWAIRTIVADANGFFRLRFHSQPAQRWWFLLGLTDDGARSGRASSSAPNSARGLY
jgi:hypothetical protein